MGIIWFWKENWSTVSVPACFFPWTHSLLWGRGRGEEDTQDQEFRHLAEIWLQVRHPQHVPRVKGPHRLRCQRHPENQVEGHRRQWYKVSNSSIPRFEVVVPWLCRCMTPRWNSPWPAGSSSKEEDSPRIRDQLLTSSRTISREEEKEGGSCGGCWNNSWLYYC